MQLSAFAYEVLDQSRISVTVVVSDDAGSDRAVYSAAEWVQTPAWAQESQVSYAQFCADRILALAFRDELDARA